MCIFYAINTYPEYIVVISEALAMVVECQPKENYLNNSTPTKSVLSGFFFAVLATIFWSGNFVIARGLSDVITPVSLAFFRWTVALLVFFPFAYRKVIADIDVIKKHIPYLLITSITGISFFNILIYLAGRTTTAVNISMISITTPVFIVIISALFLKEKTSPGKVIGVILVFTGALFLITKGALSSLLSLTFTVGDFWVLLAAIMFAVYSILAKFRPKELSLLSFQLCTIFIGLIFMFPLFIIERGMNPPIQFSLRIILSIFYVGIFASLAAFLLWNKAISIIGPVKTGMVYYLLPVFSSILALIFLGEEIYYYHYFSMIIIVLGIFIANHEKRTAE